MRAIHVGFPRISPENFDLVIATPQYPISAHPNLLRIPYALTPAAVQAPEASDEKELAALPHPRRLLIVGGPTLFWHLNEAALLRRLSSMIDEARTSDGSLLVTTSPRTPPGLAAAMATALASSGVPFVLAEPGKRPSLSSLLAAADTIAVTADSVSMVSDAIWTGKAVELVPVGKSGLGKLAFTLNDFIRQGRRLYPQDLRFFWRGLADIGVSEQLATPGCSTGETMRTIMDRVEQVLEVVE